MKKILLLLVSIALTFVFISCGDDDDIDKDEPVTYVEHDYVDLGLPSGTLWATCNVGASVPEEYGDYFAWGETKPKKVYNWSTYKWCTPGTDNWFDKLKKYNTLSEIGTVDDKYELDPGDDAAYVNWGPSWRMPTKAQFDELYWRCSKHWTTLNGVDGMLVTGPNNNTIFLPATGYRYDDMLKDDGFSGYYWSRMIYTNVPWYGCSKSFDMEKWSWENYTRDCGFAVRAVRTSQN
jgi:hypothetical protein